MGHYNAAFDQVFIPDRLTIGLMTPLQAKPGTLADLEASYRQAALADDLGFAALWTRDVPLMIPQGSDHTASALDDPFLWLGGLAAVTRRVALATGAIVLPLRHPLHVAKAALTLNRISKGRLLLGLGSGDRPDEFARFGKDLESRDIAFRQNWEILREALSPIGQRSAISLANQNYPVLPPPAAQIPMLVVGSARQSLQWIAERADGWATYHREDLLLERDLP